MPIFKIPSAEITNYPYLKKIAGLKKRVILSTGMSTLEEVSSAVEILLNEGVTIKDLTVLHATSEYPCPIDEVNLLAMKTLGKKFNLTYAIRQYTLKRMRDPISICYEKWHLGVINDENYFIGTLFLNDLVF